jgi:N-acetylornithine carbamoyltransferase
MDAANDAVIVYAKAWGGRDLYHDVQLEARQRESNKDWRITDTVMDQTDHAKFMHCLPVRRNVVVDDSVLDSPRAIHLLQAEMRLYGQKALLERMWNL